MWIVFSFTVSYESSTLGTEDKYQTISPKSVPDGLEAVYGDNQSSNMELSEPETSNIESSSSSIHNFSELVEERSNLPSMSSMSWFQAYVVNFYFVCHLWFYFVYNYSV